MTLRVPLDPHTQPTPATTWSLFGIAILISFALAIPGALLSTFYASTVWSWFIEPTYGQGPPNAVWFGIAALAHLYMFRANSKSDNDDFKKDGPMKFAIERFVNTWISLYLMLVIAAVVGRLFGWK